MPVKRKIGVGMLGRPKTPIHERIKRNSNATPLNCWEWNKALFKDGYGQMQEGGKSQRAHIVSFRAFKGNVQKGMQVCHTCDNPKCVNPEHLFLGTHQDNMNDRCIKGRTASGARNGNSKLNEAQVSIIRLLREFGYEQQRVATYFDISIITISRIHRKVAWKSVDDVRGNLQWLKETLGTTTYKAVDKMYQNMDDAINWIEKGNLEDELKNEVIDLWNEVEARFIHVRKKKNR